MARHVDVVVARVRRREHNASQHTPPRRPHSGAATPAPRRARGVLHHVLAFIACAHFALAAVYAVVLVAGSPWVDDRVIATRHGDDADTASAVATMTSMAVYIIGGCVFVRAAQCCTTGTHARAGAASWWWWWWWWCGGVRCYSALVWVSLCVCVYWLQRIVRLYLVVHHNTPSTVLLPLQTPPQPRVVYGGVSALVLVTDTILSVAPPLLHMCCRAILQQVLQCDETERGVYVSDDDDKDKQCNAAAC